MQSSKLNAAAFAAALLVSVVGAAATPVAAQAPVGMEEIQNRTAVEKLLVRYMRAFDTLDVDTYTDCFTEDGEMNFGGQSYTGAKQIRSIIGDGIIQRQQELWLKVPLATLKMYHLLSNSEIEFVSPTEARVHSYWHWITGPSGSGPFVVSAIGTYDDVIVKTAKGWRIKKRVVTL